MQRESCHAHSLHIPYVSYMLEVLCSKHRLQCHLLLTTSSDCSSIDTVTGSLLFLNLQCNGGIEVKRTLEKLL